jgi:hypothetical protein
MDMKSRSDALAAVMLVLLPVLTISVAPLAALAVAAGGPVAARLRTVRGFIGLPVSVWHLFFKHMPLIE